MRWIVKVKQNTFDGTTVWCTWTFKKRPSTQLFADGRAKLDDGDLVVQLTGVDWITKRRRK